MINKNIKEWNIAVIGAGTMGLSIAQFFAMNGYKTALYNRTPSNLEKAKNQIKDNLNTLLELGETTEQDATDTLNNLSYYSDVKPAVKDADLVIESLSENIDIKKNIFSNLNEFCSKDTILTSTTSSMNIYEFIEVENPDRVVIAHFFNPAYIMPLVEIVRGPETSDETVEMVKEILTVNGKTPAVINEPIPGFIVNRISTAIMREIMYMVEQGWTTPKDIDAALTSTFGPRYPFEGHFVLFDHIGLDVGYAVSKLLFPHLCSSTEASKLLLDMIEKGELGVKSGKGFYEYDNIQETRRNRDKNIIKMIQKIKEL